MKSNQGYKSKNKSEFKIGDEIIYTSFDVQKLGVIVTTGLMYEEDKPYVLVKFPDNEVPQAIAESWITKIDPQVSEIIKENNPNKLILWLGKNKLFS